MVLFSKFVGEDPARSSSGHHSDVVSAHQPKQTSSSYRPTIETMTMQQRGRIGQTEELGRDCKRKSKSVVEFEFRAGIDMCLGMA